MASQWLELQLVLQLDATAAPDGLPPEVIGDLAGDVLLQLGAEGYEVLDGDTLSSVPGEGAGDARVGLRTYMPLDSGPPERLHDRIVAGLRGVLGDDGRHVPHIRVLPVEDPGWAEAWKRFFRPIEIGERLLVRPPWELVPEGSRRKVLTLDPGLAFGTGNHPTTRLCLQLLEQAPPPVLFDVGCGSGILSIANALLGGQEHYGIDTDPESVRASEENAALNGVAGACRFDATPLAEIEEPWPFVVANILASILLRIAPELAAAVAPGGVLVLSGLLAREAEQLTAAYVAHGLVLERSAEEPDDGGELWSCLVMRRPA